MSIIIGRKPGGSGGGGAPSGPAGGDLTGTYPNPTIAAEAVDATKLGSGAATIGQVATADGAGGVAYQTLSDVLFESTLGTDATSIDTGANGIPAGYDDLKIIVLARSTTAAATISSLLRFNADSGNNYDQSYFNLANTTVTGAALAAASSVDLVIPAATADANLFGMYEVVIAQYVSAAVQKHGTFHGGMAGATAANNRLRFGSCRWRNTAAITRVALSVAADNLLAESTLRIYGLR